MVQQSPMGHGRLITEASRSHSDIHTHSVGLHWTSGQLVAENSTWQTTYNTHKEQTSMSSAGFEPIIPARERSQTQELDRVATGSTPTSYT